MFNNGFKLYLRQKTLRTVRRRSVVICVACKGVALMFLEIFNPLKFRALFFSLSSQKKSEIDVNKYGVFPDLTVDLRLF